MVALVVWLGGSPADAAAAGRIEFKLKIKPKKGSGPVYCRLFSGPKGFPMKGQHAMKTVTARVNGKTAKCVFAKVPKGNYAVMAFHDLNNNGKLDTNWIGIPTEGVASSNNAKGKMGPPSFKSARFKVAGRFTQTLKLKYY